MDIGAMATGLEFVLGVAIGINLWFLTEYLLHRFAMHHLKGRGIMSREHLEHHVTAGWTFDRILILSWLGVAVVGAVGLPINVVLLGWPIALGMFVGWPFGYGFYEYQHAMAHLRPPRNGYQRWLRKSHFHHHFGHPNANHGVSIPLWDIVFRSRERPDVVRVPRRLAVRLGWLVDTTDAADGPSVELKAEFCDDYILVGSVGCDARQAGIDEARAFASLAPTD